MKHLKGISVVCFFLLFSCLNAQDVKFNFNIGTASGEMKYLKKQMPNTEALIGYESSSKNDFPFCVSVGISRVKFDYYDTLFNQVYNQKTFITIPLEIRKYYKAPNPKRSIFFGIGLVGNFCVSDRKEIRNFWNSATQKESFTGFNISASCAAGYKSYITTNSSIAISLLGQVDFITSYTKDINEIRFVKTFLSLTYATKLSTK